MRKVLALLICGVMLAWGASYAQSDTEREVRETILAGYEYLSKNLTDRPDTYSKHGALEFWSSGGLMQEIAPGGRPEKYEVFRIRPKHIRVLTLVEGQAAVAHFYSEGALKPAGFPATTHYLTRVTQVLVKEDGKWKIRSSHWSPVAGGSGTTQTALE